MSMTPFSPPSALMESDPIVTGALIDEKLSLAAFTQLAGNLAGYPFVKVVVDRPSRQIHFLNHARYPFHAEYIAEKFLNVAREELESRIDEFNRTFYLTADRRFYLGIISLHQKSFFALETVEIDNMDSSMLKFFYQFVKEKLDPSLPLLFKPANHLQENIVVGMDPTELPCVFSHELFSKAQYVALSTGRARGRIRAFRTEEEYKRARPSIEWYDIIAMHRVPDDIPRVAGIINGHHTTPLSHTNVLAAGWKVPNAIQLGIFDRIEREGLNNCWVDYTVELSAGQIGIVRAEQPLDTHKAPVWSVQRIKLEEPETTHTPIVSLDRLRMSDRYRYGTKAANLGELSHILEKGSDRLVGFYKIRRPPRPNLLPHLAGFLGAQETAAPAELTRLAWEYLRSNVSIPRGIAIPFSIQQEFLESSPRIQQNIGKLKMALELDAREIDSLCLSLQSLIRQTRVPDRLREIIDSQIADNLAGVSSFVVRSSSNAEDLEGFSAAGIYESINHCTTAENIFQSIKEVWASLVSPRSIRLRHEVGISLDDCYMGVIIQDEVRADLGGVMVTTNPMTKGDFRNVYINVSPHSVVNVVQGFEEPYQYLYNTVEGCGRTLSLGTAKVDLSDAQRGALQKLALCGRLLQSHFSPDYTFSTPVDIEWILNGEALVILQLRPYSNK